MLVGTSSRAGRKLSIASLLGGVDRLAGWGLPPDLRVHYPEPASDGAVVLQVAQHPGLTPKLLPAQPVRPCGGLLFRSAGSAIAQLLILWRDETGVRGWSELEPHRPLDAEHSFAAVGRIWGRDQPGTPGVHSAFARDDPRQVPLFYYPGVDELAERAVGLARPHLVFGPVRQL